MLLFLKLRFTKKIIRSDYRHSFFIFGTIEILEMVKVHNNSVVINVRRMF